MNLCFLLATAKTMNLRAPSSVRLPLAGDRVAAWVGEHAQVIKDRRMLAALWAYNGWVFKNLGREDWTDAQWAWADEHGLVLSALWGPLRPLDGIRPYRLDFKALGVAGRAGWHGAFDDVVRRRLKGRKVIDLASAEFSNMVSSEVPRLTVTFAKREVDGALSRHSMLVKKGRGELAGAMVRNGVSSVSAIKELVTPSGFRYDPANSTADLLAFVTDRSEA